MSLTKLSLAGNNDVIFKLFLPRESLVGDIPAGDGNIANRFLQCMVEREKVIYRSYTTFRDVRVGSEKIRPL